MIEELIRVLPCFILLEDRIEHFLLSLLIASFSDIFWIDDPGVDVAWIIIEDDNFVDAEDGCCSGDTTNLDSFVVWFLGVQGPAARQGDGDSPIASFGRLEDGSRFRSVDVLNMRGCAFALSLFGRACIVSSVLMDDH